MVETFKKVVAQAESVAKGDFEAKIDLRSDEDALGLALQNMTQTLQEYRRLNDEQVWLKTGQAQISLHTRSGSSLKELCHNVLSYLCEYLDLKVGVFYVVLEEERLEYISGYACPMEENAKAIKFGEGLAGQAAQDKSPILFEDVPSDYMRIQSGLGAVHPRHIYVLPLVYSDKVMGVVELGSIEAFSKLKLDLLGSFSSSIATSLNTIHANEITHKLFEESQHKSENLERQQIELKKANEDLESSKEVLARKAEELAVSEERARASTNAKSDFLASMSHEIRTPLNGVLGMVELMLDTELDAGQLDYLQTIRQSGRVLTTVINDILDFSKMEAGALELDQQSFDVHALIKQATQTFRLSSKPNVKFDVQVSEELPPYLIGDSVRLNQVIGNLLNNAFKFTWQGYVALRVESESQGDKENICFHIEDSGIGIPEGKQKDLFQPFQQADQSTSRQYGGTGLGLSICQRLVGLMGGDISVESDGQKGSTFSFCVRLPIGSKPQSLNADNGDGKVQDYTDLNVLLVEDNSTNQLVAKGLLSKHGVDAKIASDGEEALRLVQASAPFDLILMDCEMPLMDGYQATEAVRVWEREQKLKPIHICALTAHVLQEHVSRCYVAGMNDHITKPIERTELNRVLNQAWYRKNGGS